MGSSGAAAWLLYYRKGHGDYLEVSRTLYVEGSAEFDWLASVFVDRFVLFMQTLDEDSWKL
jgi:hypothetical protein